MAWSASTLAWVQELVFGCVVHCLAPLDTEEQVVVGLVQVYHSESVNFVVALFLFYHHCHDLSPSGVGVAVVDSVIYEDQVGS